MSDLDIRLYAFKNRRNGRFLTGTDFRPFPHRQIMSIYSPPLIVKGYTVKCEMKIRGISLKTYIPVVVEFVEVKE